RRRGMSRTSRTSGECSSDDRSARTRNPFSESPFLKNDTFVLVVLLCFSACGRAPSSSANAGLKPGALAGSNVLLVTIDTLRADRVGAYSGVPLTPTLDALAARGVRFSHAYAHAPMTLPAHTSILTGLVPPTHGVRNNGSTALAATMPTLATLL